MMLAYTSRMVGNPYPTPIMQELSVIGDEQFWLWAHTHTRETSGHSTL
jgi:hypothetical protein